MHFATVITVAVVLCLGWVGFAGAQEDPLATIQSLIASGKRAEARSALDSLLAEPGALEGEAITEGEFLRLVLEESGVEYELGLQSLVEIETSPNRRGWLHMALGRLAFVKGDLQTALTEFQKARVEGKHEEGSLWEGLTAFALGDGEAARLALERVQDSGNSAIRQRARLTLGDSQRVAGNWALAQTRYQKIREEEDVGSTWWGTAVFLEAQCLEELGETDEAKNLYRLLITETPEAYDIPLARERLATLFAKSPGDGLLTEDGEAGETAGTGYSIQVGAFSERANAEGLAAEIRDRGVDAVRIVGGNDGLHRVLLGRFPDRDLAESFGDSLGAKLGLGFSVVQGQ